MPRETETTVRYVPSDECPRCGDPVDPEQGRYLLQEGPAVEEDESIESGNLCSDCFESTRQFITGEA